MVETTSRGPFASARALCAAMLAAGAVLAHAPACGRGAEADLARQVLEATGLKGGLIVHLGCGDGRLTAALRAGEGFLVHGLDIDAANVLRARQHLRQRGLYGPVSVERYDGRHLPYADGLVNLLVAERPGDVPPAEAMRVLAPGGSLYAKQDGRWQRTVKPRPANTDEWTHFLHDAGGNPVSRDAVVGPPGRVQWIAGPRHARSHEHAPSTQALVSSGGRIFYLADEGAIDSLRQPARWHLLARDAYNGLRLWQRSFDPWYPHIVNWGSFPTQLQRRLVAVGDRVYVTLGLFAPVSVVDGATGQTLKVYEQTEGTEEILCHDGTVLLATRKVTGERVGGLEKWLQSERQRKSPLYVRETAEPLLKEFRGTQGRGARSIVALDAETGRVRWRKEGPDASGLRADSLCAVGGRVFYQAGRDVTCLDLKTGRPLWATPAGPMRVACDRGVICASDETVSALSAETGKALWSQPATLIQIRDVFVIGPSVWVGGFKPFQGRTTGKRGPAWGPYFATQRDLTTGKVLRQIAPENPGHHHRCWRNKATERYILGGRRGVEFLDLQSGEVLWHSWVRGVCKYGVMPSNGLLYAPPHACGCYVAAKLEGFHALAPAPYGPAAATPALEKGPAFEPIGNRQSETGNSDWPTYRHDAQRSGCTKQAVPAALRIAWQANVGGQLTSPTIAGGKVFIASVDEQRVCALDDASGKPAWDFTPGGRVDSPPTLHAGRAIFGSRDGCLYSVRASDGALAWRLRLAGDDRRVTVCGQLESPSPVPGSVLIADAPAGDKSAPGGVVYCTAGRSSYLDGGIALLRVRADSGEVLSSTPIYSPDPETGRQPAHEAPAFMPGSLADILSADARCVYLRDSAYDMQGRPQAEGSPHLFTLTGFLDDTWPHRSYWILGTKCSLATGCSGRDRELIYGRLLVFDGPMIYGYGRANVHWSNALQDGPYRLFARKQGEKAPQWAGAVPIQVRAMVLAGGVLFVAGPPVEAEAGSQGPAARLLAVSAADGSELARRDLDAPPVFDGLAAAGGKLYLALENGRLLCLAP